MAAAIERVLDPSFLKGLENLPAAELRDRRRECERVEGELSMQRAMLQGTLDLLAAEIERRGSAQGPLVDRLRSILTRPNTPSRGARPKLAVPGDFGRDGAERILTEGVLARLPEMSDEEVSSQTQRFLDAEREVSGKRRQVQRVLDAVQDALAACYLDGRASPLDVLRDPD